MDESSTSAVPELLGDAAASGPESLECLAGPALPCGLSQDQEAFWKLGLTKPQCSTWSSAECQWVPKDQVGKEEFRELWARWVAGTLGQEGDCLLSIRHVPFQQG